MSPRHAKREAVLQTPTERNVVGGYNFYMARPIWAEPIASEIRPIVQKIRTTREMAIALHSSCSKHFDLLVARLIRSIRKDRGELCAVALEVVGGGVQRR